MPSSETKDPPNEAYLIAMDKAWSRIPNEAALILEYVESLRAQLAASQRDTERLREENAQLRQFIKDTPAAVLGP